MFRCLSGVCRSCDNRADKTLKAWPGDGCPLKAKCQCAFDIRILNLVQGTNNLTVFNLFCPTMCPPRPTSHICVYLGKYTTHVPECWKNLTFPIMSLEKGSTLFTPWNYLVSPKKYQNFIRQGLYKWTQTPFDQQKFSKVTLFSRVPGIQTSWIW